MKIKYNLKWILIEEDGFDFEETFYSKYDEMPDYNPQDVSPEWREYHADMKKNVVNILDRHLKDHSLYPEALELNHIYKFLSDFENHPDLSQEMNDHIENSRADTWIKAFDHWRATDDDIGRSLDVGRGLDIGRGLSLKPGQRHND
tara:strand:+ start:29 stop:466 length:438 start_codon:yes stop_codon:yes gene_type:complete